MSVDLNELARGLDIREEMPAAIGDRELGSAAERNRAHDRSSRRIDCRAALAFRVHRKNTSRRGIEKNRVGVATSRDATDDLSCGEIEDRHARVISVADEAAPNGRSEGDAMHARCISYSVDNALPSGVDHEHVALV